MRRTIVAVERRSARPHKPLTASLGERVALPEPDPDPMLRELERYEQASEPRALHEAVLGLKSIVSGIQAKLGDQAMKGADGRLLAWHEASARKQRLKRDLARANDALRAAKIKLYRLNDTFAHSPEASEKGKIIPYAYALLCHLSDQGVDLGPEGERVLCLMERYVPMGQLDAGEALFANDGEGVP